MKLHRVEGRPDWQDVAIADRNMWQRLAVQTGGWATPGNMLTVVGVILALVGLFAILQDAFWLGLIGLLAGRSLDIADGLAADATGTKSPLGEKLDAGFDKLITALTLLTFLISGLAPGLALAAILVPNLLITGMAFTAGAKGLRLHPSRAGKVSMAFAWLSLTGFLLVSALHHGSHGPLFLIAYACSFICAVLALVAAREYAKELRS